MAKSRGSNSVVFIVLFLFHLHVGVIRSDCILVFFSYVTKKVVPGNLQFLGLYFSVQYAKHSLYPNAHIKIVQGGLLLTSGGSDVNFITKNCF